MKMQRLVRVISGAMASFFVAIFLWNLTLPVFAQATSTARGYSTKDTNLILGMAAALAQDDSQNDPVVERANRDNIEKFVGIVTTKEANTITLSTNATPVIITTSGEAETLATDVNGQIKKGDFLTISPLKGIIMKADTTEQIIFGVSLEDFSETGSKTETLTGDDGVAREFKVNALSMEVSPNKRPEGSGVKKKPFLTLVGESITGKAVSEWQVLAAMIMFFILLVVEGSIIYGATHTSIEAVGRNPLAHKALSKQLIRVLTIAFIILVFGGAAIVTILWI